MNTTIFNNLINHYNEISYTHEYIFGFAFNGVIMAVITDCSVLPYVCSLDRASRGQGYSLRFKPNKSQKTMLMTEVAIAICSKELFDDMVANSKYNKGEIFEKLVTEQMFGQVWKKDNVPFTKGGDVEDNGTAYQIKFEGATFTNEKTLARLA